MFNVTGRTSIALGKPVVLSDAYLQTRSGMVVDGFTWGECVFLWIGDNHYFMVDLVDYYEVEQIVLYPTDLGKKYGEFMLKAWNVKTIFHYKITRICNYCLMPEITKAKSDHLVSKCNKDQCQHQNN